MHVRVTVAAALVGLVAGGVPVLAEDWPEFRGAGRRGQWSETGLLENFPIEGLVARWRVPVKAGYSGPAVADGRVFLTDWEATRGMKGIERALALDEVTGEILWTESWDADYAGIQWETGPGATPTVDDDRVYVLGRAGKLSALRAENGEVLWRKDYGEDYGVDRLQWGFDWGFASAPLVDDERLITFVGGPRDARVVAFDKMTGEEIWRALPNDGDLGVAQPMIIEAGGARQLIVWNPEEVASLDPVTGSVYWQQPYVVGGAMTVAMPVQVGDQLFFSTFYDGPMMLNLDSDRPGASIAWKGSSQSEIRTEGLHAVLATPIIDGGYIYGFCSYGQMRCLNAGDGERVWESQEATVERRRWVSGFMVRNGNRVFINNDRGDLIIARLSPDGYDEVSRTSLVKPTSRPGNRRELKDVNWVHPAYANKHVITRNDDEIVSLSLDPADYK
ncbi:MAG: PQQ-binding-like beta-propeller repeat protein [Acidobacteriota bacterium]|nr:PQQ-binding-like beta-propeller repeat protein [Acidobacteriota bacterium]